MKYGKLIDGILYDAPKALKLDGLVHYNPSYELYQENGYLPIVEEPYPETNEEVFKYYISKYEVVDEQIVKKWIETEPPKPESAKPTIEERVALLEHEQEKTQAELSATMGALDILIMGSEV